MTITVLPARNEYTATAAQTVFNYTFKIFENTDLNVYITPVGQEANDSTDLTTAYTVDAGTIGDEDGGFITMDSGVTAGSLVTIVSDVPESRTTDYQFNGDFIPDTVNADFDRVVQLTKQVEDTAGRTLTFQQSLQNATALTLPSPQATYFLRWNAGETGLENVDLTVGGAPTDSSLVTYDASNNFAGGTSRTVENKLGESVSVKDFGAVGDGVTDDTAAFQTAQAGARAAGAHLLIPAGVNIRVTSQLTVYDNEVWQLDGNIIRDWTSASGDKLDKATIRNEHALTSATYYVDPGPYIPVSRNTGIRFLGNGEIKNSAAVIAAIDPNTGPYAGPHLLFHASDNMHFGPITLRGPCAEWATMLWGDNLFYDNLKVRDQSTVFEDGIHIVGGTGHTGTVDAQSGDDSLAIGANFNQPVSAVSMTVVAESISGNAVTLVQRRNGSTAAYGPVTTKLEDIYINAVGTAGSIRNGLVNINTDETNANYDTIENVTLDVNLTRGTGTHDLTNAFGVWMRGGKNIKLRGSIKGSPREAILATNITSVDFDLSVGAPQDVNYDTVVITSGTDVHVGGTVISAVNRDGIELVDTDAVVTATVVDIGAGFAGVTVNGSSVLKFGGKCTKLSGDTNTRGVTVLSTSSEVYIENGADIAGVDIPLSFNANPSVYRAGYAKGLNGEVTISGGNLTIQGRTEVGALGQGGVSDAMSIISNGQKGQTLTLRNGEASPATVTISVADTGNIVLSASPYLLDTSEKALELKFDGTSWQELARY